MGSTRQNASFQIYQDMVPSQNMSEHVNKPRPQLQPSAMPLQPISNPQAYAMQPPMSAAQQISPLKSQSISPHIPQYHHMSYVPIPPPQQGNVYTDSPMKGPPLQQIPQFHHAPVPTQPMFSTFDSNLEAFPQENFHIMSSQQNESVDFPMPPYPRRAPLKRSMSDATALNERPLKRFRQDDELPAQLPEPQDMPVIEDDGGKPGYSYAQMIGMAILRAPNRRLTLAQIYEWISNTFAHYREDTKQGWHNSIRHNLSLNKAFKKQERPKGDAGKGCYWTIEAGMEAQFCKEKTRKAPNIAGMAVHQNGMRADMQVMAQPLAEAMTPSWSVQVPQVLPPRPQTAPALPELSSDATLPASDPDLHADDSTDAPAAQLSSPVPPMNSSPPVVNHHRTISSPVHIRPASSRLHKRSMTGVDDSGYFSELTSSVRRPKHNGIILTSEINLEQPRKKRGRAEEEILRMRSSPHVTPKPRRFSATSELGLGLGESSPPLRPSPSRLNPATPAVHFKKPCKPPPSVSPNTQLQRHRLLMQEYTDSPLKQALPGNSLPEFSPQLRSLSGYRSQFEDEFSIFDDSRLMATPGLASSPLRSVKRSTVLKSNTSAGGLRDVTNTSNAKLNLSTPSKMPSLKPPFRAVSFAGSPLKKSVNQKSPDSIKIVGSLDDAFDDGSFDENTFLNYDDDNDNDTTLVNDENGDDDGFDLMKGFSNIGSNKIGTLDRGTKKHQRPAFGRSITSLF